MDMSKRINLSGKIFNRLTVLYRLPDEYKEYNGKRSLLPAKYKCKCECGNITDVTGYHLKKGNTKSCGCYQEEFLKNKNNSQRYKGTKICYINGSRKARSNTGIIGIHKRKDSNKYSVFIQIRNKMIYLGQRDTEDDAKKLREWGENTYYKPIIKEYNKLKDNIKIENVPPTMRKGDTEQEILNNYIIFLGSIV
jgi:hypothetical protein